MGTQSLAEEAGAKVGTPRQEAGDCAFPGDAHHHQRLEAGSSVPGVSSV